MESTTMALPTNHKGQSEVAKHTKTVYSVLMTGDYDRFKLVKSNRELNQMHIKRLVESFQEEYLICPIIVNEKFEVIDGQHRLEAAKITRKPVYYIQIKGYGIKEVQIFNANQKNWTKMDFLNMFVTQNKKPYVEFEQFMKDFPDFGIQAAERILTGAQYARKNIEGVSVRRRDFEEGKLIIPNLQKSYLVARKIYEFKPYFPEFSSGLFVSSIMPLFNSKHYNQKEMIHKLGTCPTKLVPCRDVVQFRALIEDIYNWKRVKENKVSFKYE